MLKFSQHLLAFIFTLCSSFAFGSDFLVTNANDSGAGSLRQAILDSNGTTGPNKIQFAIPGSTKIYLTTGELVVENQSVKILGPEKNIILDAGKNSRVLNIIGGGTLSVEISHLDVTGGRTRQDGGGILVTSTQSLNLSFMKIYKNLSQRFGGGIHFEGTNGEAHFSNLDITENEALNSGGGASVSLNAKLTFEKSSIHLNKANVGGGLRIVSDTKTQILFENISLFSNLAILDGGALFHTMIDPTKKGSKIIFNNSTLVENSAPMTQTAGIVENDLSVNSCITLQNTILVSNSGLECVGFIRSMGHNLIGAKTNGCDLSSTSLDCLSDEKGDSLNQTLDQLKLAPPSKNGATTVRRLLPGSAAIDQGNQTLPGSGGRACSSEDQRGKKRGPLDNLHGSACDIGAYELPTGTDLEITQTVDKAHPEHGASVLLTVQIKNIDQEDAESVFFEQILSGSSYFQVLKISYSQGSCTPTVGFLPLIISCDFGELLSNESLTVVIEGIIFDSSLVVSTAQLASNSSTDLNPKNNRSTIEISPIVSQQNNNPLPQCGNGTLDAGEQCDPSVQNGICPLNSGKCDSFCKCTLSQSSDVEGGSGCSLSKNRLKTESPLALLCFLLITLGAISAYRKRSSH